jgi:hypothetical protein
MNYGVYYGRFYRAHRHAGPTPETPNEERHFGGSSPKAPPPPPPPPTVADPVVQEQVSKSRVAAKRRKGLIGSMLTGSGAPDLAPSGGERQTTLG